MKIGIYKITNKINGKNYIGQSIDIERRWTDYKYLQCSSQPLIYNALKKYGIENFEFSIVEECTKEQLNDKEKYYIQLYNSFGENGYNLTSGGDCNYYQGNKLTFDQVIQIRELLRTTKITNEDIAKRYNVANQSIDAINIGESWYDDTIKYPIRRKTFTHEKNIYQIDIASKEIVKEFESISQAAKELNLDDTNIGAVCLGKRNSAGGYWFCYTTDYENRIVILDNYKLGKNNRWYVGKYNSVNKMNLRGKPVWQYDIYGEFIKEYPSINEAFRQTSISHIGDCCRGERNIAGGYIWKFKEGE